LQHTDKVVELVGQKPDLRSRHDADYVPVVDLNQWSSGVATIYAPVNLNYSDFPSSVHAGQRVPHEPNLVTHSEVGRLTELKYMAVNKLGFVKPKEHYIMLISWRFVSDGGDAPVALKANATLVRHTVEANHSDVEHGAAENMAVGNKATIN
jgi:hypothetical protein